MVGEEEIHDMAHRGKRPIRNKIIKYTFLVLFIAFVVSITAIAHFYGPYMGKVVDLETGAPIEGAVVLLVFYTESFYAVSAYADAIEILTDSNGEFKIPKFLSLTFHPFSVWESEGYVKIFKPEYGAYPDHDASGPLFIPNGTVPQKKYITIKLPKLKTIKERKELMPSHPDIPKRKMRYLLKYISEERVNVGLSP